MLSEVNSTFELDHTLIYLMSSSGDHVSLYIKELQRLGLVESGGRCCNHSFITQCAC